MATVVVTATAIEDLDLIIATRTLPVETPSRVKESLEPLAGFPLLGVTLTERWEGFRFLLGPWSWIFLLMRSTKSGIR